MGCDSSFTINAQCDIHIRKVWHLEALDEGLPMLRIVPQAIAQLLEALLLWCLRHAHESHHGRIQKGDRQSNKATDTTIAEPKLLGIRELGIREIGNKKPDSDHGPNLSHDFKTVTRADDHGFQLISFAAPALRLLKFEGPGNQEAPRKTTPVNEEARQRPEAHANYEKIGRQGAAKPMTGGVT